MVGFLYPVEGKTRKTRRIWELRLGFPCGLWDQPGMMGLRKWVGQSVSLPPLPTPAKGRSLAHGSYCLTNHVIMASADQTQGEPMHVSGSCYISGEVTELVAWAPGSSFKILCLPLIHPSVSPLNLCP